MGAEEVFGGMKSWSTLLIIIGVLFLGDITISIPAFVVGCTICCATAQSFKKNPGGTKCCSICGIVFSVLGILAFIAVGVVFLTVVYKACEDHETVLDNYSEVYCRRRQLNEQQVAVKMSSPTHDYGPIGFYVKTTVLPLLFPSSMDQILTDLPELYRREAGKEVALPRVEKALPPVDKRVKLALSNLMHFSKHFNQTQLSASASLQDSGRRLSDFDYSTLCATPGLMGSTMAPYMMSDPTFGSASAYDLEQCFCDPAFDMDMLSGDDMAGMFGPSGLCAASCQPLMQLAMESQMMGMDACMDMSAVMSCLCADAAVTSALMTYGDFTALMSSPNPDCQTALTGIMTCGMLGAFDDDSDDPPNDDSCIYAYDGACDDGGPGAPYSYCDYGTDLYDCGWRDASDGMGGYDPSDPYGTGGYDPYMGGYDPYGMGGYDAMGGWSGVCDNIVEDENRRVQKACEYVKTIAIVFFICPTILLLLALIAFSCVCCKMDTLMAMPDEQATGTAMPVAVPSVTSVAVEVKTDSV